jgi:2-iminobutanoate/2-iminopropanoate deaminase
MAEKNVISTKKAPEAIGPYSAGIRSGKFVYTSGQIGLDPQTGELVAGGIEEETRRALTNLKHVLEAAGANLSDVIKTTVFLRDIDEYAPMNAIYAEYFSQDPPARSAVQVAALPKGAAVEIEAVAVIAE